MTDSELKKYTSRIVELETAVYTQKKLMDEHEELIKSQRPKAPQKPNLQIPVKPAKPVADDVSSSLNTLMWIVGIFAAIGSVGLIVKIPLLGIILTIPCVLFFISIISNQNSNKSAFEEAQKKYERDMIEYKRSLEDYNKQYQITNNNYSNIMHEWSISVDEYDQKSAKIIHKHDDVLSSLQDELQKLYSQNVIFPKYRNMVAITTINEYLMSGRCYELEGPNGAYNLYEMELRQNIIVGQLSKIVGSLEQIRNNQFMLYQEIVKANSTIKDILSEVHGVNNNTKLTAYFSGVTALIESSPKVYVGHTF